MSKRSLEKSEIFSEELESSKTIKRVKFKNKLYYFINEYGEILNSIGFKRAYNFCNGLALVQSSSDNLWYYLKPDGSFLNKDGYEEAYEFIKSGIALVRKTTDRLYYFLKKRWNVLK